MLLSDLDYPRFEVLMGGNDAYRETLVVDAEEFIGMKSYKAKGKRLTTFEVETINELEPIRFAPEKEEPSDENNDTESDENLEDSVALGVEIADNDVETIETTEGVEITIEQKAPKAEVPAPEEKPTKQKKEKPLKMIVNDSTLPDEIVDGDGQLTLF